MNFKEAGLRGAALRERFVMDVHGHLGTYGMFNIPVATPEGVVAIMDRIGIDVLCVSHVLSLVGDYRQGNDYIAEAMRAFPGRFLGYAVANPNYPADIESELDRCIERLGMSGIKVHNSLHGYPVDGPACWRIYGYAARHGSLPVLGHGFGDAHVMERIATSFPEVPFIVAHSGGGYHGRYPEDIITLGAELDNVYLDLCSSTACFGALEELVSRVGAHKILYGSDLCWQQATHQIGRVLFADIAEEDKEAILGLNAARLFGIEPRVSRSEDDE